MMNLDDVDFSTAESAYLISNTPLFLIKKLRMDAATSRVKRGGTSAELVEELEKRVVNPPLSAKDRVIPFVLLVAIGLKQDRKALVKAAELHATDYRWFRLIADTLLSQIMPTSSATLDASRHPIFSSKKLSSNVSSSFVSLKAS